MTDLSLLMTLLARVSQLGQSGGLTEADLERALDRLLSVDAGLVSSVSDDTEAARTRFTAGLVKNLDDDPMLVLWALKLAARLGDRAWSGFFVNFIQRIVMDRRAILDRLTTELGHSPPVTIVVNPTMACNLACRGCYSFEFARDRSMPPELFRKVLRDAREMGTRLITVSGGEPFAYPRLLDIVEEFSDLTFLTYTNGTLVDDRMADRVASLGNVLPAFSVEGYEEQTDERRGHGVYRKVLDAMERLRERGVLWGISMTLTRHNASLLASDELLDFYLARGAWFAWLFSYVPVGRSPELELMPTPSQRDHLRAATVRWRRTRPVFLGDFWNDGATCGGCLSASRYCFVAPDGKVQPCTFVHFHTHNVNDHSLAEIFGSPFFRAIRAAQPYDRNLLRPCKIIDHPAVLRKLVRQCDAKPSYPSANAIVDDPALRCHLDAYAQEHARFAERAWKSEDYGDGHRALVPFSGLVDLYERFPDRMRSAELVTANRNASSRENAGGRPSFPCAPDPIPEEPER